MIILRYCFSLDILRCRTTQIRAHIRQERMSVTPSDGNMCGHSERKCPDRTRGGTGLVPPQGTGLGGDVVRGGMYLYELYYTFDLMENTNTLAQPNVVCKYLLIQVKEIASWHVVS